MPEIIDSVACGFLPLPWGQPNIKYGYRVAGPYDPSLGLRYNPHKLLIDPYAHALSGTFKWHEALFGFADAG